MADFFEIDDLKKTVKTLNLDDFSVEDLKNYIQELENEIKRVELEMSKKSNFRKEAESIFKK